MEETIRIVDQTSRTPDSAGFSPDRQAIPSGDQTSERGRKLYIKTTDRCGVGKPLEARADGHQ